MYMIDNIVKSMAFDSYICVMHNLNFENYVKEKHGYTDKQFKKYTTLYRDHLEKITVTDTNPGCAIYDDSHIKNSS